MTQAEFAMGGAAKNGATPEIKYFFHFSGSGLHLLDYSCNAF
jgi:hypothetical protein